MTLTNSIPIIEEIPNLYRIIPLIGFRNTPGVSFNYAPMQFLAHIDAVDRVIDEKEALSPGPVGNVPRPWYMDPFQDDNLLVLHGMRHVDIYTPAHGRVEHFVARPNRIERNGQMIYEGAAMLVWPRKVFHRIRSGEEGSASVNLAVHYDGFNIRTNFNIYDVDIETGKFHVIRKGEEDQIEGLEKTLR